MSGTSIELSHIARPQAAVAKSASTRRPSTIIDDSQDDQATSHSLERTATVSSKSTTTVVITSVTLITGISTLLNGLTTVILPTMAVDLDIPSNLLLWPSSIQALTCGCVLLLSGSIADALGSRFMYMLGSILQSVFTLGCGLSRNATQLIIFRGLSGIAIAFCLPSAVSIITSTLDGKRRNFAFAAMGGGQPVGFSIGLTLGGVLTDSIGWRWGFYSAAVANTVVIVVALWGLPSSIDGVGDTSVAEIPSWPQRWHRVKTEIDWVGALIASTALAMLSYVFASIAGSRSSIKQPSSIVLLVVALLLIPLFIFWVGRQENKGRPAIIPNSLWRNRIFSTICIAVFFTWGSFNALETILTFYFQDVQKYSATQTSIYFLPAPIAGVLINLAMGYLVQRVQANWLVIIGCAISFGAPIAMVNTNTDSNYWSTAFLANILNPTGADSLFTISNLLITSVFHAKTQALAGGVFNTISQIGKSVGLGLVAVIAADVTQKSGYEDKKSPEALLEGYKATYWFCFACIAVTVALSTWGLRGIGKVGHKRD